MASALRRLLFSLSPCFFAGDAAAHPSGISSFPGLAAAGSLGEWPGVDSTAEAEDDFPSHPALVVRFASPNLAPRSIARRRALRSQQVQLPSQLYKAPEQADLITALANAAAADALGVLSVAATSSEAVRDVFSPLRSTPDLERFHRLPDVSVWHLNMDEEDLNWEPLEMFGAEAGGEKADSPHSGKNLGHLLLRKLHKFTLDDEKYRAVLSPHCFETRRASAGGGGGSAETAGDRGASRPGVSLSLNTTACPAFDVIFHVVNVVNTRFILDPAGAGVVPFEIVGTDLAGRLALMDLESRAMGLFAAVERVSLVSMRPARGSAEEDGGYARFHLDDITVVARDGGGVAAGVRRAEAAAAAPAAPADTAKAAPRALRDSGAGEASDDGGRAGAGAETKRKAMSRAFGAVGEKAGGAGSAAGDGAAGDGAAGDAGGGGVRGDGSAGGVKNAESTGGNAGGNAGGAADGKAGGNAADAANSADGTADGAAHSPRAPLDVSLVLESYGSGQRLKFSQETRPACVESAGAAVACFGAAVLAGTSSFWTLEAVRNGVPQRSRSGPPPASPAPAAAAWDLALPLEHPLGVWVEMQRHAAVAAALSAVTLVPGVDGPRGDVSHARHRVDMWTGAVATSDAAPPEPAAAARVKKLEAAVGAITAAPSFISLDLSEVPWSMQIEATVAAAPAAGGAASGAPGGGGAATEKRPSTEKRSFTKTAVFYLTRMLL